MQGALPKLRLLGLPEVQRGGETHTVPVIDKPWALLFFLAVEREPVDRESLAAFLWPDKSPNAGRANLSATLYTLGRWFGPYLPIEKNARTVCWGCGGVPPNNKGVSGFEDPVDLARFFSDAPPAGCDRLHSCLICPDCRVATASRLALCRGAFLEGALLKVPEPFLRWVDRIRERVAARKAELQRQLGLAAAPEKTASQTLVSVSGPLWERRQVTFLGVLVSAPAGMEPEERLEGERAWRTAADSLLRARGGWDLPSVEISFLAAFGYPLPREDAASAALTTARALVRAFRDLAPPGFEIRTVLHTGEGTIDRFRNSPDATGDRSLETVRLVREAPPGEIAASAPAARLLSRTVRSVPLEKKVPDRTGSPLALFLLTGEEPMEGVPERTLFGREEELSRLRGLWKEVSGGGFRTVWLTGEPGIGKSALVRALSRLVTSGADLPPGALREYRCHPDSGESPWDPVVRALRRHLGPEGERRAPVERRYRAERLLLEASLPVSDTLPALLHLLEGPGPWSGELLQCAPEGLRPRIEPLLLRLFSGPAGEIPLLLVVEDLHWADHATADLLRQWHAGWKEGPALLLLTARDEAALAARNLPPPDLAIPLRRLDRGAARLVIESAAEGPLSPERLREILDRGEGVPLFLRELTRSRSSSSPSGGLPSTLRDLLAARLGDPGEERGVLETAACIGSSFSLSLLAAVESERTGGPVLSDRLRESLRILSARGLLEEDRPGEDPVWDFTHVLLREAVLAALPSRLRRSLHRAIVSALRNRFPERADREPEILAEQLALAGDAPEAVEEWIRAASQSASLGASHDALASLGKALSLVRETPDFPAAERRELEILLSMGPLALAVHGYGSRRVEEVYGRASALCQEEGRDCPFPLLLGLASSAFVRTGPFGANPLMDRLEKGAREAGEEEALRARLRIGAARFWEGRLDEAQKILSEVPAHSGSLEESGFGKRSFAPYAEEPGPGAYGYLAFVAQIGGRINEALRFSRAAGSRVRRIDRSGSAWLGGSSYTAGFAETFAAYLHFFRGDRKRASERAAATVALSERYGYLQWETMARLVLAWCREDDAAVREARERVERLREMVPGILPIFLLVQAETAFAAGFPEAALEAARQGREESRRTGTALVDPEFDRVAGEAFLALDPGRFRGEAERLFLAAGEEARKSGCHWFAFRSALALSRIASPEKAGLSECLSRLSGGGSLSEVREARILLSRGEMGL